MNNLIRSILNSHWLRLAIIAALLTGLVVAPQPRASALSTTWYVSPTGSDGNSCTSPAAACQHINAAIGKSASDDTIILAAGTYLENITIAKSLTLQGAGSDVTFIDGDNLGSVASIFTESTPINVNLSGITFQHGLAGTGGGIYHSDNNGTLSISNSTIFSNTAQTGGGGIFNQGYLKLTNVSVDHNINSGTQRGGGILSLGFSDLINVTVANNQAQGGGGGIGNQGVMTLTNSFIGGANRAGQGGGAYNYGAGARLTLNDTTVIGNQATAGQGGGLYNEGGQIIAAGATIIGNQSIGSGGGLYSTNLGPAIGQLSISASSIQNNVTSASGGGLDNESNATLDGVIISSNRATVGGGGLYNGTTAQLTASATTIQNNIAVTAPGGGVFNLGNATLSGCPIVNNEATAGGGGGIENGINALLILNNSGVTGNRALNSLGGGLHNYATADLTRVTIQNNLANGGGGLYNESTGRTTVNTSVIISNTSNSNGGGINNQGALTVTQSSIVSNTSVLLQGGGLFNKANAQLTNVTISNNSSPAVSDSGGAIYNDSGGALQARHATISHNQAPGIVNNAGSVTLINTIAALSSGGTGANCNGTITTAGHNLDSGTSCGFPGGNINNADPQLGPLQDNGGGTLTRILLISSPAVDAADDAVCASIDQRNIARPQGDHCDIGAYEVIGFTNATGQNILANQCITSTLHVSSSFAIGSLLAGTNITFTPRGDLRINLYAPFGTSVNLMGSTGGSGENLNILWDNSSVNGVVTSTNHTVMLPFYYYVHQPAQSLVGLFGRSVRGDWRLEICNLGSSTGRLNRWSLIIPDIRNFKAYLPVMRRK